ncbi:MAG: O-antigen ligase family protein [Lachnospiraceae bacterium]|nr:O-antigen ligase family protein [Lachnospiraceae bacterium]
MLLKPKKMTFIILFGISLIYILMRPVLEAYVTTLYKPMFILIMIVTSGIGFMTPSVRKKIGNNEIVLLIVFYIYIICNALAYGGTELLYLGAERYVFLTLPLFAMPLVYKHLNWKKLLEFISLFGIIDATCSIVEFVTHNALFPAANVDSRVEMHMSSYYIVRTYGLNGNFFLLAEILSVCGLASFFLLRFYKEKKWIIAFMIISIGILATGSRGYYVSYGVGLVVMYLADNNHKRITHKQLFKIFLIFLGIVLLLFFLIGTDYLTGIDKVDQIIVRFRMIFNFTSEDANIGRLNKWNWAIHEWIKSPLFGNGACCTDTRYSGYYTVPESGILKRLVELGVIGTTLQYASMYVPLYIGIKKYHRGGKKDPIVIFCISILVCFFVEDIILQRYTGVEYTIISWALIEYVAYEQKFIGNDKVRLI